MIQQDRRQLVRWQLDWQAKIRQEGQDMPVDCQIQDLNLKGCKLVVGSALAKDKYVRINLSFSDEFTFSLEAWVVWHKEQARHAMHGVYFTKMKDEDREKIYEFLRRSFPEKLKQQWWRGLNEEKGESAMEDRRIFARFNARFPVKFLDLNSGKEGQAQTHDISAKGMGLVSNVPMMPETPLELWIELPDRGEPLYSRGEVVWSSPIRENEYRIGVTLEKANLMGLSRVLRCI